MTLITDTKASPRRAVRGPAFKYALLGTVLPCGLVYAFTGNTALAAAVAGVQMIVNYFIYARFWNLAARREQVRNAAALTPCVVWFTGLPSAGKTTLALLLKNELEAAGSKVEHLDGDTVRAIVPGIGFSRAERNDHIRRMGFLASRLEQQGVTVIASFVSPYRESRAFARRICKDFIEVYLSTSIDECSRRDVKGLYQESKDGKRPGMTGVDDPYEPPLNPELTLDTGSLSKEECVERIRNLLLSRGLEQKHGSSIATRTR